MGAVIRGNNQITWGAGGTTNVGKVQSASKKLGGDKVELLDENGETFSTIYFNNKHECEFEAIMLSSTVEPTRGDPINIGGVVNALVDDVEVKWVNNNAKMISIRATKYANF